jgi:hypothetical protein
LRESPKNFNENKYLINVLTLNFRLQYLDSFCYPGSNFEDWFHVTIMCGNIGLLLLQKTSKGDSAVVTNTISREAALDELDRHVHEHGSVSTASEHSENAAFDRVANTALVPLLKIIDTQTSATEVRGGQGGGISCIEYKDEMLEFITGENKGTGLAKLHPSYTRVRCLGRRRYALAQELTSLFKKTCDSEPSTRSTVTIIGHTRFATGSFNRVPELHPHEWVPFREERVWNFRIQTYKTCTVGLHISHNGDFDALEIYGRKMVNGDVGLWLERALHTPNDTTGDSPKVAGYFDLFFVQGRWQAAARLAYLRCILSSPNDVSGKGQLSKSASNTFPGSDVWETFEKFFSGIWMMNVNNVMVPAPTGKSQFTIHAKGEAQLRTHLYKSFKNLTVEGLTQIGMGIDDWSDGERNAFIFHTVRGFLRYDLYTAMTEFLGRAEGSFGLQVHSTLEPGVVVIASKGQPMSVAFDPAIPLCLFGSEAQAVAAPVDESGRWLPYRIDLDSRGEVD